jgi:riboflavin kinase / FMN adenylyltransferase
MRWWLGGAVDRSLSGVANDGNRTTVDGGGRYLLEVHLFSFAGDLYGRHTDVEFRLELLDE